MAAIAVDASIVAAMVFGEDREDEARDLLRGGELFAPALLAYELTSVARTKMVRNPGSSQDIKEMLVEALEMDFRWAEVSHPEVLDLALATGLST